MENANDKVKIGHIAITITSDFMDDNGKIVCNTPIELKMAVLDSDNISDCLPSMKHIVYQDNVFESMVVALLDRAKQEIKAGLYQKG